MSSENTLNKERSWLAAEYALGVSEGKTRQQAEHLLERDASFRRSVDAWQNQLSPMLNDVDEVRPPAMVWANIEKQIAPVAVSNPVETAGAGIWKLITALTSTVSVACVGGLLYVSGGDFTSGTVPELKQRLAATENNMAQTSSAFEQALSKSSDLEQQLAEAAQKLEAANTQVASAQAELETLTQEFQSSRPLVASLTQSGDAPAFVAQYDPIKKALLIRTAVEDTDEKVPEIWLIPAQGDREGEVLSLGVMNENAPDEVKITDDFINLIGEGGTLAITMEPPGGSPTGVATGPVIALGKLQAF